MDLRSLDMEGMRQVYFTCLTRDFPADERMPWKRMVPLMEAGIQRSVGFWDEEGLAAYAVFITTGSSRPGPALLNYFAVQPDRRGTGVGSRCLELLRERLEAEGCCLLFEVEDPDEAAGPQELRTRRRRVDFYLRCGAVASRVGSVLYGVKYRIMSLSPPGATPSDETLAADLESLYRSMLRHREDPQAVFRVYRLGAESSSRFSRELGRALTFLMRSRKRFMGEKLRESGFSGAMYLILLHVDRHPGATQDSIATHMYLDKCSVARRTKRLEELGCLYRETDPQDRRQNNLFLTQKGQDLAPKIRSWLCEWGEQVSSGLDESERGTLLSLLTKMTGQDW